MDLTDAQWEYLKQFIPDDPVRPDKRGRPWKDQRTKLNGMLWILRTGAPWKDLPSRYGSYQTVHRCFHRWSKEGLMDRLLRELAEDLRVRGGIDVRECYVDGTFAPAKKGALQLGLLSGERAPRSWQLQTLMVYLSPYAQRALRQPK